MLLEVCISVVYRYFACDFLIVLALYRQYDTMICPTSAKTLNKGEKVVKWVKEKVWKKQEEAAVLPHPSQMRRMCLEFHLVPFKSFFLDNDSYNVYEISVATDNIVHIFECCYQQKVTATRYFYGEGVEIKLMDSVKEVCFLLQIFR